MTAEHQSPRQERDIDWKAGRRAFIRTCGLAAAGAAALGVVRPGEAQAAENIDIDVLNFALNLEYLEAEFYLRAVSGNGLSGDDTSGRGPRGPVIGGKKVPFQNRSVRLYAEEIAEDELAHVRFLRAGLADQRVSRPKIDLRASFTAAARAAGLVGPNDEFDAFADDNSFLLASFIFEDVGVTAYKGAAPLLTDKALLEAAAGILAVEAYHAGTIRTLLYGRGLFAEAGSISDARDSLDGASDLDQGIGNRRKANIVPADENGIAYSRSVQQVKNIVYLNPEGADGGFFPDGINGAFG